MLQLPGFNALCRGDIPLRVRGNLSSPYILQSACCTGNQLRLLAAASILACNLFRPLRAACTFLRVFYAFPKKQAISSRKMGMTKSCRVAKLATFF